MRTTYIYDPEANKPAFERWFAWYPVEIIDYDERGVLRTTRVWLETIERMFIYRRESGAIEWAYRIPGVTNIDDNGHHLYQHLHKWN